MEIFTSSGTIVMDTVCINLKNNKIRRSSIDLNIHNSKVFSSAFVRILNLMFSPPPPFCLTLTSFPFPPPSAWGEIQAVNKAELGNCQGFIRLHYNPLVDLDTVIKCHNLEIITQQLNIENIFNFVLGSELKTLEWDILIN